MVKNSPNNIEDATNNMTVAVCDPPSTVESKNCFKLNSLYKYAIPKEANTAKPAASVAVTNPPNIPPKIIIGKIKVKPASFAVLFTFLILKDSSIGKFFLFA